jgi:hypothetical protein
MVSFFPYLIFNPSPCTTVPSSGTSILYCDYWLLGFNPFYFLNPPEEKSQQKIGGSKSKQRDALFLKEL